MGCATSKQRETDKYILEEFDDTIRKISVQELNMLKMIYFDLALRNGNKKIEKETFFIFFQKNGLWGHRLFRQFDMDDSGFVCLEQFVVTTAKIIKADQDTKIGLLYEFFAFGNEDKHDGIIYSDFLRVLYNYSKEELKSMLQAEYKVDNKLKSELINVLNEFEKKNPNELKAKDGEICIEMQDRSDSITQSNLFQILNAKDFDKRSYQMSSFIGKPNKSLMNEGRRIDSISKKSDFNVNHKDKTSGEQLSEIQRDTAHTNETFKNRLKDNVKSESGLLLEVGNKKVTIKAGSYHALVKKVGALIFNHFELDKKEGRLLKQQFVQWIKLHKDLYESYYKGFNQHIWEMKDGKFRYLSKEPEIESSAKYVGQLFEKSELTKKSSIRNCKVFLQGSVLFVSDLNNKENLFYVIYLEGLQVAPVKQERFGYGIEIRHKHNIYPKKNIFFDDEMTCKKWMENLKDYKGFNVHEKYEMGMRIGAGKYSIVCECRERQNNKRYAMKEIDTFRLTTQEKSIISHESNIMSGFDHQNLLKFRETIKAKNKIFIITELVEGKDLLEFVKERQVLTELQAAEIAKQIINGVNYMHRLGIVHRDLKPENIMIEQKPANSVENQVKIIDFGFANYIKSLEVVNQDDAVVGTPNYIAPEVYKKEKITEKADIFSIGTIIYFMLSGQLPFNSDNLEFLVERTLTEKCSFVGKRWLKVSKEAKDLIQQFLEVDVAKRITLKEALSHNWFRVATKIPQETGEAIDSKKEVSIGSKKLYIY